MGENDYRPKDKPCADGIIEYLKAKKTTLGVLRPLHYRISLCPKVFRLLQRHKRFICHGAVWIRGGICGINNIIEQRNIKIVSFGVEELLRRGLNAH